MSQTIDHRIVEMRFDNKQFEAGAKETMGTLGRLKEALKLSDSSKALENLGKATKDIKLDGISAGIEALQNRFSTLGIIGMRVIENLTDGFMNKLNSAVNFVTDSIVSGGIKRAMNIENAHFQLQALLKDEEKVQAVMDNAMESVDGTAYAYDEAAKAASQFAASGIQAGDEMLGALKGITGVAAMTNSQFEDVSRIFTTVAGNGRLMGDQLLQLSSRGLNAASTIADYFREVRGEAGITESKIREMVSDGEISFQIFSEAMTWAFGDSAKRANETFTGALSNMKSALARIGAGFISPLVEQNGEMVQLFNALRVKINDVKSALVFDEQRSAIDGLKEVTGMTDDALSDMFKTIKENGGVTIADMDKLKNKGADAYTALTKYINGISDGSIRASYAITTAVGELTNGTQVSTRDIRRFVEEGKIDLATFTSAMETEFGTEKTLSKQFTDWLQDHIHTIVSVINNTDMTKPMQIFYDWLESVKNLLKGLLSVVSPVGKAFSDVFLAFNADDVITFSEAVERLTSSFRLQERESNNLHDAFKGIFDVGKLLIDIFFDLLGVLIPINKPVLSLSGGILHLAGSMGRGLTEFTKMIRSCDLLKRAFGVVSNGVSLAMDALSKLIEIGRSFILHLSMLEGTTELINAVISAFDKLGTKATPYIEDFINETETLFKSLFNIKYIDFYDVLNSISESFSNLARSIENFSFDSIGESFDRLKEKAKSLGDLAMSNKGIAAFVTNFKEFMEELREAFTLDNLLDRVEKVMDVFGKFFRWVKDTMGPAFEDFNIGSAMAAGGGLGIIYAMIKAAKGFEALSKAFTSIPAFFGTMKGTLVAYQKELKADALLKTAAAIGVLAGALVLLSFADIDRLLSASFALSMVAGVLMLGVSKLLDAVNKGKELNNALNTFAKGVSKAMKKLATAVEIKALGGAIKSFGETILMVAGSIVALGLFYRKDPEAFKSAIQAVSGIGIALAAIGGLMILATKFMSKKNARSIKAIGSSLLMITGSLTLIVLSISKLMGMELPADYGVKLAILGGIIAGLGGLAVILGIAARISGGNQLPKMASTIKSLAILMVGTVLAIKVLFDMSIPEDYGLKLGILAGIFVGFGVLLVAMAAAAKLSGGNSFKAAGTILSMALFLGVVVAALFVLTLIPGDKMLKGALVLGGILVTLGVALAGAGQISDKNTYKVVLAMALTVGVITAALAILTMIPWKKLAVSATALGGVLLVLALNFKELSKMDSAKSVVGVMAMIAATLTVAYALYTLSEQPWANLLAAGTAMSATLLAFGKAYQMVLSKNWSDNNVKKIGTFLLMTLAVVPIGVALGVLSHQPWEGLLASAAAISGTILAFSKSFEMILSKNWSNNNVKKIGTFLLMTLSVIPIGTALGILAFQPWENLLAATASLSLTLAALTACFVIISKVKVDPMAIATVVAGSASLLLIAGSIALLAQFDGSQLLNSCLALSAMLVVMIGTMAACGLLSSIVGPAIAGVLGLGIVIAELALVLAAIGALAQIPGLKWLINEGGVLLEGIGIAIGRFIGGIIGGVMGGISAQLPQIGSDLSAFMENLQPFIEGTKGIDATALAGVGLLAAIIAALTVAEIINGIASLFGLSLVDMATELSDFMVALRPFIENSKDLTPEMTQACLNLAGMILALTGAEILAGVANFFGLSGSIADFGEELAKFGPHIKQFAEDVKDVKPEAVQGAAAAAEIMAEMAKKLPGTGGFVQKIFGEKSLAEFGEELVKFGPNIKEFGDQVKDVKPDAVEGAAAAAEIMANLATKLPPQGGFVQKIFGERSLAEFGEELILFGPKIAQFAQQVANVDSSSVEGCSLVTSIMTNLANNLPSSDTLWNKIFGGGQVTLSEFGDELVKFGASMSNFSSSISGVDSSQVNGAIDSFKNLVDLVNYIQGASAADLVNFSTQLGRVGTDGVAKFVQAFTDGGPKATAAINTLLTNVTNAIQNKNTLFQTKGVASVTSYLTGIKNKYGDATSTGSELATKVLTPLQQKVSEFTTKGTSSATQYLQGFKNKYGEATSTGQTLANNALAGCQAVVSSFTAAGQAAGQGFVNGLKSMMDASTAAGKAIGQAAYDAAKKALNEHSPSKKMEEVGNYAGLGFVNKLMTFVAKAANAGKEIGEAALDSISKSVNTSPALITDDLFDMDPVIRPVVDLSNVVESVSEINRMFNDAIDYVSGKAQDVASGISANRSGTNDGNINGQKAVGGGNTYNFIQNNNSPKALSRIDIYRQTKNQFSRFKEVTDKK